MNRLSMRGRAVQDRELSVRIDPIAALIEAADAAATGTLSERAHDGGYQAERG